MVAVGGDEDAGGVAEIGAIAGVVPDGGGGGVGEAAPLGVELVGVDAAGVGGLDVEGGKV